jgi:hypothetical protein
VRGHRVQGGYRRSVNRRCGSVLALVLVVALGGCGANQATTGKAVRTGRTAGQQVPSLVSQEHGMPQRLSSAFALLRAPADGMPASVQRSLHVPFHGMLWDQSRRLPVSSAGGYWLAPGTRYVCIVAVSPAPSSVGTVCATIEGALHHGIASTSIGYESDERTVVGVAPEGVRSVSMDCAKSRRKIRVRHDGLFTLRDAVMEGPESFVLRYR